LALEFAALVRLRRAEPEAARGVPVAGGCACFGGASRRCRILLLAAGIGLEVQSRAIGLPGVLVAVALAALGPPLYGGLLARRARLEPGRAP